MPPKRQADDTTDIKPPPAKRGRPRRTAVPDQLGDYKVTKPKASKRATDKNDLSFKRGVAKDIDDLAVQARAYQTFVEEQGLIVGEVEFTFKLRKAQAEKVKDKGKKDQQLDNQPAKMTKTLESETVAEDSKAPAADKTDDEIDILADIDLPSEQPQEAKKEAVTGKPTASSEGKAEGV